MCNLFAGQKLSNEYYKLSGLYLVAYINFSKAEFQIQGSSENSNVVIQFSNLKGEKQCS